MNFIYITVVVLVVVVVVFVVINLWRRSNPPHVGPPPGPPPTNLVTRELYVADPGDTAIWVFGVADVASTLLLPPLRFIRGGPLGEVGGYPTSLSTRSCGEQCQSICPQPIPGSGWQSGTAGESGTHF
jgi:hypothetical protein